MTSGTFPNLKEEILRRENATSHNYSGKPPFHLYWLIYQHGEEIIEMYMRKYSVRLIAARLGIYHRMVVRIIAFIGENQEPVAEKKWGRVQDLLFARWPDFKQMDWYKEMIAPGPEAYFAKAKVRLKKRRAKAKEGRGSSRPAPLPPAAEPTNVAAPPAGDPVLQSMEGMDLLKQVGRAAAKPFAALPPTSADKK